MQKGKLIVWKDDRGFGFIEPVGGGQRVFLHISAIKDANRRPQVGDEIHYQVMLGKQGKVRATMAFIKGATSRPAPVSSHVLAQPPTIPLNPAQPPQSWLLETLLLSLLPLIGSIHFTWTVANPIPLIVYPLMSFVTFKLYANDKFRAQNKQWRTRENTLHLCELMGGWPGAFVAQRRLRHKNRKASYQTVFWAIVMLHLAFWINWFSLGRRFISL
jgi:uncharacterized membrane protein YsdA (DUF1294 family)/cold shock CspA family protein